MKGIVLAGGTGSRLFPLTKVTNKHLLPVGNKPMIYYPIQTLIEAGIREILIVTGTEHMGAVVSLLGSGKDFDCHFTYKVQDEAGGIAQALSLAEDFSNRQQIVVILGDNIFGDSFKGKIKPMTRVQFFLKKVPDPSRFGVAEIKNGRIISIEEKPKKPKSHYAVTGLYVYDSAVFDYIRKLKPSARGELEISDVNNIYIKEHHWWDHSFMILKGYWTDAGTPESLERASKLVKMQKEGRML